MLKFVTASVKSGGQPSPMLKQVGAQLPARDQKLREPPVVITELVRAAPTTNCFLTDPGKVSAFGCGQ
jgi:hypothetical protein